MGVGGVTAAASVTAAIGTDTRLDEVEGGGGFGFGSKAVVTGDITQVDLPSNKESGLKTVQYILNDIPGIAFVRLSNRDVVRHEIVQRIVRAYEDHEQRRKTPDNN